MIMFALVALVVAIMLLLGNFVSCSNFVSFVVVVRVGVPCRGLLTIIKNYHLLTYIVSQSACARGNEAISDECKHGRSEGKLISSSQEEVVACLCLRSYDK